MSPWGWLVPGGIFFTAAALVASERKKSRRAIRRMNRQLERFEEDRLDAYRTAGTHAAGRLGDAVDDPGISAETRRMVEEAIQALEDAYGDGDE